MGCDCASWGLWDKTRPTVRGSVLGALQELAGARQGHLQPCPVSWEKLRQPCHLAGERVLSATCYVMVLKLCFSW